ncbi:galactose mutarotase [Sphingobacterium sp. SRCM116780]|uniref:aldose epimerase family protein n=1 Tax=Sphingobacterium sp. SRCM116780 TaxID=2907623 RepID=UPI001F2526CB|nr:aldose epimerase family protein [Sphingobacterium sp. SRCM116780]UIR54736.1 galactose mutarotase [Sphingobacterium sp. SRCM116780]
MNRKMKWIGLASTFAVLMACQQPNASKNSDENSPTTQMDSSSFAGKVNNMDVHLYELKNKNGMKAYFTNFGARIVGLWVPDQEGNLRDVVLGFAKGADYNNPKEPFFGTIVGPFGNRIAKGKFKIDGQTYKLAINNGVNTLHGGFKGVHFANWSVKSANDSAITFSYTLPDGAEGFPGNIAMEVTYSLNDQNELTIAYQAQSDKKTVINLTNHAYFNLNGEGSGTVLDHQLQLFADQFTPVDSTLIPTGELASVKGTAFDFTVAKTIGKDINANDQQLFYGKGYDHNFVLNKSTDGEWHKAALVVGDKSGIEMEIWTQEPGIQFYSGNFMNEQVQLKNGKKDSFRTAFCLEPQHFPDSPNQPSFPSTLLTPGQIYKTKSLYRFSTK